MHPSCFGFLLQEVVDIWSPFSIITLRIVDWDRVTWFTRSQESSATEPLNLVQDGQDGLNKAKTLGGPYEFFPMILISYPHISFS